MKNREVTVGWCNQCKKVQETCLHRDGDLSRYIICCKVCDSFDISPEPQQPDPITNQQNKELAERIVESLFNNHIIKSVPEDISFSKREVERILSKHLNGESEPQQQENKDLCQQLQQFQNIIDKQESELAEAKKLLVEDKALDRSNKEEDSLRDLIVCALNGLYYRDKEIKRTKEKIAELKKDLSSWKHQHKITEAGKKVEPILLNIFIREDFEDLNEGKYHIIEKEYEQEIRENGCNFHISEGYYSEQTVESLQSELAEANKRIQDLECITEINWFHQFKEVEDELAEVKETAKQAVELLELLSPYTLSNANYAEPQLSKIDRENIDNFLYSEQVKKLEE